MPWFFFDEANRRIHETERLFHNLFGNIFESSVSDPGGIETGNTHTLVGEVLKKWEEDIVYLSDYDSEKEKKLRRLDMYSFYFRISVQKKQADKQNKGLSEKFGREAWC